MARPIEHLGEQILELTAILRYSYASYLVLLYSEPLIVTFSLPCNFEKETKAPKDLIPTVTTLIFTIRNISYHIVNCAN
jgi:hypothetical protein